MAGTTRGCPRFRGCAGGGYTPESIRAFCEQIGVAKRGNVVDAALLRHCAREDLNRRAPRVLAVLRPLKVVIENYPEGQVEELDAVNNPEDASMGTRKVPFSRELYVERDDFREDPPRKFYRLSPGREVRLRYGYLITCTDVVKDEHGEVVELRCTYDPETRGGQAPDGRRVRGTIHWVSAAHSLPAELRLYDHLFLSEHPDQAGRPAVGAEPGIAGGAAFGESGAGSGRRRAGRPVTVRETGLLRRGPRLPSRSARLQPHRAAPRLLGQDREGITPLSNPPP